MYPDPPYFSMIAGLAIAFFCGKAFEATLKQQINQWSQSRSSQLLMQLQGLKLSLPFLGIGVGACVFLGSGLMVFGTPLGLSYCIALPMTLLASGLVWSQLGTLLMQLQEGGSEALKIDAF